MSDNQERLSKLKSDIVLSGVVTLPVLVSLSEVPDTAKEQLPKDIHYFGIVIIDAYLGNAPTSQEATLATDWNKLDETIKDMNARLDRARGFATKLDTSLHPGTVSLFKNRFGSTISMIVGISDNTYVPPTSVKPKKIRKLQPTQMP